MMSAKELRDKINELQSKGKLPANAFAYRFSLKCPVFTKIPTDGFLRVVSWGALQDLPEDVYVLVATQALEILRASFPTLRVFQDTALHEKLQAGLNTLNARPPQNTGPNSPALRALYAERLLLDSFRNDDSFTLDDLIDRYTRLAQQEDVLNDWESQVPAVNTILTAADVKKGRRFTHSQAFDDYPTALSACTTFVRKPEHVVKFNGKFYVTGEWKR